MPISPIGGAEPSPRTFVSPAANQDVSLLAKQLLPQVSKMSDQLSSLLQQENTRIVGEFAKDFAANGSQLANQVELARQQLG